MRNQLRSAVGTNGENASYQASNGCGDGRVRAEPAAREPTGTRTLARKRSDHRTAGCWLASATPKERAAISRRSRRGVDGGHASSRSAAARFRSERTSGVSANSASEKHTVADAAEVEVENGALEHEAAARVLSEDARGARVDRDGEEEEREEDEEEEEDDEEEEEGRFGEEAHEVSSSADACSDDSVPEGEMGGVAESSNVEEALARFRSRNSTRTSARADSSL